MRFDEKYPDAVDAQKRYPDKLMGPHKEVWIDEILHQSWRMYPYSGCGKRTGWRICGVGFSSPVCSEECRTLVETPPEATAEEPSNG